MRLTRLESVGHMHREFMVHATKTNGNSRYIISQNVLFLFLPIHQLDKRSTWLVPCVGQKMLILLEHLAFIALNGGEGDVTLIMNLGVLFFQDFIFNCDTSVNIWRLIHHYPNESIMLKLHCVLKKFIPNSFKKCQ